MNLSKIIDDAIRLGYAWDFFEEADDVESANLQTVPGEIVTQMQRKGISDQAVGLLSAYAAKRSLACWFNYCQDTAPLSIINTVIDYWFCNPENIFTINEKLFVPVIPMENGEEIRDCRRTDTLSASSAVANCVSYACHRSQIFAITAISHSHIAFESCPDASSRRFEEWLTSVAFPQALALRRLTSAQQWAMADFKVPDQLLPLVPSENAIPAGEGEQ